MMSVYSDCFPRNSAKTQMLSEKHGPKNIEDASMQLAPIKISKLALGTVQFGLDYGVATL